MKLIKISSVWCPSCLIMNPRYNELSKNLNINIEEYDYDMDTEIVSKYKIGDKSKKDLNKIFEDIGV